MKPSGRTPFLSITTTPYHQLFPLLPRYSAISTQRMGRKQADVHLLHRQYCRFASNGKEHRVCSIQHLFRRRRQVHCALVLNALQHGTDQQSNAIDAVAIAGVVQGSVPVRVLDRRVTVCGSRKRIETTILQQIRNNRGTPVATSQM